MASLHQQEFKDGDVVMYESTTGTLLGPFEIGICDDGTVGLWSYKDPAMIARYGDAYFGEHVHGIIGGRIIMVGWPENGKIEPSRIRPIKDSFRYQLASPVSTC